MGGRFQEVERTMARGDLLCPETLPQLCLRPSPCKHATDPNASQHLGEVHFDPAT